MRTPLANETTFPVPDGCGRDIGITRLEYFAAAALTGLLADSNVPTGKVELQAFDIAKAMCAEAEKRRTA